jgi:uncharacterized protein (DUF58 family)
MKALWKRYIGDMFISRKWYLLIGTCVVLLFLSFLAPRLFRPAVAYAAALLLLTLADYVLLFFVQGSVVAERHMPARLSLGDENTVSLTVHNSSPFTVACTVIEELPVQFQVRDFSKRIYVQYQSSEVMTYDLRPVSRGVYEFGDTLCYVSSPISLLQRRYKAGATSATKVYPSYQQLKQHQLTAVSGSNIAGVKKIRRLGHSLEFEKIKDYVTGDDVRTINWKATARSSNVMVNMYTDARQQQIYCLIDKGRNMKMPFDGMTLLDYSINTALSLLNVALMKQDKAGLITFSNKVSDIVPADRRNNQLHLIMETLYKQQTEYKESDYKAIWNTVYHKITQRSLLIVFTNFETYSSLERQLPFLKRISQRHLVCVVFFQNTLLKEIHETAPDTTEGIYIKTIADQFAYEKRLIVKELRMHGILSILTTPQSLTVDVINKYVELKARQMV